MRFPAEVVVYALANRRRTRTRAMAVIKTMPFGPCIDGELDSGDG